MHFKLLLARSIPDDGFLFVLHYNSTSSLRWFSLGLGTTQFIIKEDDNIIRKIPLLKWKQPRKAAVVPAAAAQTKIVYALDL